MKGINLYNRITNRDDKSINSYFKDINKYPILSSEDEYNTAILAVKGDQQAIDKLVTSNLRFVITVAKQYQSKGLPLIDLINEGNLGLIQSVHKYNPERGFRFMSYAIWWVRQSIIKALSNTSRAIRVPYTKASSLHRIIVTKGKFEQDNGREPSDEELSTILGISVKTLNNIIKAPKSTVSLETPFNLDTDAGSLLDVTPSGDDLSDTNLDNTDLQRLVKMMINKLDARMHDVLAMYYGLNGVEKLALKDISTRFNFTEERARQLKNKAIRCLYKHYAIMLKNNGYA